MSSVSHGLSFLYVDGMLEGLRCNWAGEKNGNQRRRTTFSPHRPLTRSGMFVARLTRHKYTILPAIAALVSIVECPTPYTTTAEYMCCFLLKLPVTH